jgi:hypothetical protein
MTGAFDDERKKSACAIVQNWLAQNDYEQQDKHLVAQMIPISLTIVAEQAALGRRTRRNRCKCLISRAIAEYSIHHSIHHQII